MNPVARHAFIVRKQNEDLVFETICGGRRTFFTRYDHRLAETCVRILWVVEGHSPTPMEDVLRRTLEAVR